MNEPFDRDAEHRAYREYARKWDLIENGPRTTNFQQLLDKGVELPELTLHPRHRVAPRTRSPPWASTTS